MLITISASAQDVVQDRVSSWLSAFYMAQSAGRFAGPLVIGAVTRLALPDGEPWLSVITCCLRWLCLPSACQT